MADIDMTSSIMEIVDSNVQSQSEYLYPHGVDCMSILVPSLRRKTTFLLKVFHGNTNIFILIFVTFLFFVMSRIFFEYTAPSDWFSEFLVTLGIFLAQNFIKSPKSKREYIWIFGVLIFAYISIVLLSSILYQSLVVNQYGPEIDTLEQLANSDLNIVLLNGQMAWHDGRYIEQ